MAAEHVSDPLALSLLGGEPVNSTQGQSDTRVTTVLVSSGLPRNPVIDHPKRKVKKSWIGEMSRPEFEPRKLEVV